MKKTTSGFTIIELLIVIVVIGILAAITVVAFTGIQGRAMASSNVALMSSYRKSFALLKAETGALPTVNACLGQPSLYPSGCNMGGQSGVVQPAINAQLASYGMSTSNQKNLTQPGNVSQTIMYSPAYYGYDSLLYLMPPDKDCGLPVLSNTSGTWGLYGEAYSTRTSTYTFCILPI